MKLALIIAVSLMSACATEHRPHSQDIKNVYIDCTNRKAFEAYYEKQLRLTDADRIDSVERQYYSAIKEKLWTLRATCR